MSTILGLILSVTLLSSPHAVSGNQSQLSVGQIERLEANESTFTVQNDAAVAVGLVKVTEADQNSAQINVTGPGTFNAPITSTPVTCSVNGQMLVQGVQTRIYINDQTTVKATWTADIVVIDPDEK